LIDKKNILLHFILGLRHHLLSSKCAYGEKIYLSLSVLQKSGGCDILQKQFPFFLVLYQFAKNKQKMEKILKKTIKNPQKTCYIPLDDC
jgi:hypothetical protein